MQKRPKEYDLGIGKEICERVSKGEYIGAIVQDKKYPCRSQFEAWVKTNEELRELYKDAEESYDHVKRLERKEEKERQAIKGELRSQSFSEIEKIFTYKIISEYKENLFDRDCSRVEYIRGYLTAVKDLEKTFEEIKSRKQFGFFDGIGRPIPNPFDDTDINQELIDELHARDNEDYSAFDHLAEQFAILRDKMKK